ncbi:MAG: redox-sensing transcriptional repressor Rex [Gemmatimonadetes bacterium]|nr:redox-sensing transcriptional repressor Rex [Gemmatimonadota bacterium]NNK48085.1 redox-sensing transcriptional repressor Rex [Gemmatimonadota bacterium]
MARKISDSTVRRLSRYLRRLRNLDRQEVKVVSSRELAESTGTTAAQVRKDLSHFGSFGKRGHGYAVPELRVRLEEILGLTRRWRVAVLGVGKIGSALLGYGFFAQRGFDVVAAFDSDRTKIGWELSGVRVQPLSELEPTFVDREISIAIIATPVEAAQEVATRAVRAGARAILNFAPIKLHLSPDVAVREMDVTLELEGLCYMVTAAGSAAEDIE